MTETDRRHERAVETLLGGDMRARLRGLSAPVLVAVAGDSGSGKTTYTRGIERLFGGDVVSTITLDGYHKEDRAQRAKSGRSPLDPRANHLKVARGHLEAIRRGEEVEIPIYDHRDGVFLAPRRFRPTPVVLVEGLHALYPEFLPYTDFRIYVDSARDVKWHWKFERDVHRRGYDPEEVNRELHRREAAYTRWIDFQKTNADVVIRIQKSEIADLALDELKGELPENCFHIEIIVTPTEVALPPLFLPVDLNNMTRQQANPFMLANVPSSYWGKPVNVVHVDGMIPDTALDALEREILRMAGLDDESREAATRQGQPSTMLFTQLLVSWPFLGYLMALLQRRRDNETPPTQG